ncbi:MAG: VWA domain-containing protein, partial [Oxalobacteraceae bacterium]
MATLGGAKTTALGTSSTVKWGNARYRVALALDNTGSMAASGKMDELKKAANQLIEDFASMAKTDGDVYISIVPFAETVKIGTGFKNANWLKWSGGTDKDSWEDMNGTCKNLSFPYSLNPSSRNTRVKCESVSGTWQPQTGPSNNWAGCVMDRDKNYDASNTLPNISVPGTLVWPVNDTACPVEILGMTPVKSQKQMLLDKVAAMTPSGATNQTIGMAWAWMTHTIGAGPYPAAPKEPNYEYKDVIILLTDGANTRNRWDGNGSNQSAEVDARQALLCNNIAIGKFSVFAIQVSTAFEPVSAVTKACATNPDDPTYYSNITSASQMS